MASSRTRRQPACIRPSPPAPPGGHRYTAVAAGPYQGFGLLDDGTIVAWGQNDVGQCNVPALPEKTTYTAVDAGYSHGVALRSDGSIASWGVNTKGVVTNTPTTGTYTNVAAGAFRQPHRLRR